MKFINVVTADDILTRINISHIIYYGESAGESLWSVIRMIDQVELAVESTPIEIDQMIEEALK